MSKLQNINNIPAEKFAFANNDDKIFDAKFSDKPIGYFKDAFIRFRKNKASVVASIIIIAIILFAIIVPFFNKTETGTKLDPYYAKMGPYIPALADLGIANGSASRTPGSKMLIYDYAIGIATQHTTNDPVVFKDAVNAENKYQAVITPLDQIEAGGTRFSTTYKIKMNTYLEKGFIYKEFEQDVYRDILRWQEETGIQVIFPLIDTTSKDSKGNLYTMDPENANYWYKMDQKGAPLTKQGTQIKYDAMDPTTWDFELIPNYLTDENGDLVYYKPVGGGDESTCQYSVRIFYYNYYQYLNGNEPTFIFGTDSQGYNLAYRLAVGIRLSLILSVIVSAINFIIGAIYGAIEGYYGGTTDIVMQRISEILGGVPFTVVATLFQMHLAVKVGAIPSLIFAFVMTGWLGTAGLVRTQFYRFKHQEYVMAARTLGAKDWRIIWKHIFPNTLGTIVTSSVLVIPGVIFSESMLAFLGIVNLGGAKMTSLGTLLSDASNIWTTYPHLMIFPALVISLLMICFNLFGNGLRDAFNPSLRGVEE